MSWRTVGITVILGFVASWVVASRLRRGQTSRVEAQILAAAMLGGIPAAAIFTVAWLLPGGAHVVGLAFGCCVGGILGAAGAWAVRGRDRCPRPALAFVATLIGATLGSAIGAAIVFAIYASGGQLPARLMLLLAAAYVGSFAALGFQIGAG